MKKALVIVGCLVAVAAISHITMSLAQLSRESNQSQLSETLGEQHHR